MDGKQINKGDRVQDKYGNWYTVYFVYDNMVYVYETDNVIHASNIIKIVKSGEQIKC